MVLRCVAKVRHPPLVLRGSRCCVVALWVVALGACDNSARPPRSPPTPTPTPTPAPVTPPQVQPPRQPPAPPPDPLVKLAARGRHTCGFRQSGAVACWGYNGDGQLGDGTRTDQGRPVAVAGVRGAVEVDAGLNFSCAREKSGRVLCWGNNEDGQLGDGKGARAGARSPTPVTVQGLSDAVQISLGEHHACALRRGGTVRCWGLGGDGQLGTIVDRRATATDIAGLNQVVQLASGANHVCARRSSGAVMCWGRNTEGQLGDGVSGSKVKPVAVQGLADADDLVAGANHVCAARRASGVVCWGSNTHGQLGDGKTGVFAQRTPVAVQGLSRPAGVALGKDHSCARSADGRGVCWGQNNAGQLGDGSTAVRSRPTAVARLNDIADLALGAAHTCALQRTGNVTCWGSDDRRALGLRRL